jgi:hypothetical protein
MGVELPSAKASSVSNEDAVLDNRIEHDDGAAKGLGDAVALEEEQRATSPLPICTAPHLKLVSGTDSLRWFGLPPPTYWTNSSTDIESKLQSRMVGEAPGTINSAIGCPLDCQSRKNG